MAEEDAKLPERSEGNDQDGSCHRFTQWYTPSTDSKTISLLAIVLEHPLPKGCSLNDKPSILSRPSRHRLTIIVISVPTPRTHDLCLKHSGIISGFDEEVIGA
ncbi:MAG: hypothetical protein ACYTGH_07405 [Planctomycetota bacterium]